MMLIKATTMSSALAACPKIAIGLLSVNFDYKSNTISGSISFFVNRIKCKYPFALSIRP